MRLTYYFVLIFTMQLGLYLIGYQAPLMQIWTNQNGQMSGATFLQTLANAITSDAGIISILAITALTVVSLFLGFSAMFIIPLAILLAISNMFVFPTQFLFGASCGAFAPGTICQPPFFLFPILIIMNMLLIFAYLEFVRGSG